MYWVVVTAPNLLIDGVGVGALVVVLVGRYFVKPNFSPVDHGDLWGVCRAEGSMGGTL